MTTLSERTRPAIVRERESLARYTTLEIGGPARYFATVRTKTELFDCVAWAVARGVPWFVLGGGSNVVASDAGFEGLVIHIGLRGVTARATGSIARIRAAAGEPWNSLVERTVDLEWLGLECLGGIPGLCGATPIQNVGAYGHDVSEVIEAVTVLDVSTLGYRTLSNAECEFGYRNSVFKRDPRARAWIVTSVDFVLTRGGTPEVRYPELRNALAARAEDSDPSIADVYSTVLALRRAKSMVLDPMDENRRSVGSFFLNPVVPSAVADDVFARAVAHGSVTRAIDVPRHDAGGGRVKLPAAWLLEHAGFSRGTGRGNVGVSTRHALALVNRGRARASELLGFARDAREAVFDTFGIRLELEPVLLGHAPLDRRIKELPLPMGRRRRGR